MMQLLEELFHFDRNASPGTDVFELFSTNSDVRNLFVNFEHLRKYTQR